MLMLQIPAGLSNNFAPTADYKYGAKFQWTDKDGVQWEVWMHSPSTNENVSHYLGGQVWVVKIRRKKNGTWYYLLGNSVKPYYEDEDPPGSGPTNGWGATAKAHIPLAFS
jgi:hypothetical protein